MGHVAVNTTQNVQIKFEAASVMHRVAAYLIDVVILFSVIFLVILLSTSGTGLDSRIFFFAILFLAASYPFIMETLLGGRTIGKVFMKIRVVRLDGSPPSVADYFIRWLLGLVEITTVGGSIAFVTILISKKSQRLGDLVAGTTVIGVKKPVTLRELAMFVEDSNSVAVPEAVVLSDVDVETIRQVLTSVKTGTERDTAVRLLWETAEILRSRLGTGPITDPLEYLKSILESYQVLHRSS